MEMSEINSKSKECNRGIESISSRKNLQEGFINAIKQKLVIDFNKLEHARHVKVKATELADQLRREANERKKREVEIVKKIMRENERELKLIQFKENDKNRWMKKWPTTRKKGVLTKVSNLEEYMSVLMNVPLAFKCWSETDLLNKRPDLTSIKKEEIIKNDFKSLTSLDYEKEEIKIMNSVAQESEPKTGLPLKVEPFRKNLDFITDDTEMVADVKRLDALKKVRNVPSKSADFLSIEPHNLVFLDYRKHTEYIRKIKIFNLLSKKIYCKFPTVTSEDDEVLKTFQVNPAYWIKMLPYQSKTYIVTFRSGYLGYNFEIALECLISINESSNHNYFIPIKGISQKDDITVEPKTLYLPPRGIWQIKKHSVDAFRKITIKNFMNKPYKLVIENRIMDVEADNKWKRVKSPCNSSQEIKELSEMFLKPHKISSESDQLMSQSSVLETMLKTYEKNELTKTILEMVHSSIDNVSEYFFLTKRTMTIAPYGCDFINAYFVNATHVGFHQSHYDFKFYNKDSKLCYTESVLIMSKTFDIPISVEPETLDMRNSAVYYGVCEDFITVFNRNISHPVFLKVKMPKKYQDIIVAKPNVTTVLPKSQVQIAIKFCIKKLTHEQEDMILHCPVDVYFNTFTSKYRGAPPKTVQVYAPCNIKSIHRMPKTDIQTTSKIKIRI